MKQTDKVRGQFHCMGKTGEIQYALSFDITEDLPAERIEKGELHLAFALESTGWVVAPAKLVGGNYGTWTCRSIKEIETGVSENPQSYNLWPWTFIWQLSRWGLTPESYKALVLACDLPK